MGRDRGTGNTTPVAQREDTPNFIVDASVLASGRRKLAGQGYRQFSGASRHVQAGRPQTSNFSANPMARAAQKLGELWQTCIFENAVGRVFAEHISRHRQSRPALMLPFFVGSFPTFFHFIASNNVVIKALDHYAAANEP